MSTLTQATSSEATSTSITPEVPEPTTIQVVANPSFETGDFTSPWKFTGNGNVQSNTNNAYQSYDGTHFA
jgi:hypothetical protein